MVFVASRRPDDAVLDYHSSLGDPRTRTRARENFHVLEVPDLGGSPVAAKLLQRPDLLDSLRDFIGDRPAVIEPWNVTDAEVEVACRLGVPINGASPALRYLGFKSEGRRLLREAGVPIPFGVEDVASVDDVRQAIEVIRAARPGATAVVVKLDDSGSGDGNVVLDLRVPDLEQGLLALPGWYLRDLELGGVVEERVAGVRFTSPSAQIDVLPDGNVVVLATHEQVLGGPNGQVYMGCRFPADPVYASDLAEHAVAAGHLLASRGVVGRVAVDFAAVRDSAAQWSVYALELNLRKGGTTHPYTTLRSLVPGKYDPEAARWTTEDGGIRAYAATDNLVNPEWQGIPPSSAIDALAEAGIAFEPSAGLGVVLHMLLGLSIDGRLGVTAIGTSPEHADDLYAQTSVALSRPA